MPARSDSVQPPSVRETNSNCDQLGVGFHLFVRKQSVDKTSWLPSLAPFKMGIRDLKSKKKKKENRYLLIM